MTRPAPARPSSPPREDVERPVTAGCWACADRAMHDGDVCERCGAMADAHGVLWLPDAPEPSSDASLAGRLW